METWNRLTAVRGKRGGGDWLEEDEWMSQRTYMNDPWTWTEESGLTVEVRGMLGGGGQREKMG